MDKTKEFIKRHPFVFLLIIITFAAALRIYYIYQKEALHIDELSSFQIINGTSGGRCNTFDEKYPYEWTKGKDFIDDYFTIHKNNLKKDLQVLLRDTTDSPHPNLYYIALRLLLFNGIRGVDGLFKFYGIGLNIFLYCIGAFFLYFLFNNIYKNKTYALLAVFFYSTSTGAISTSLFIRMYELLSLSIILTSFTVLKLLDKEKPRLLDFILLSLFSTLGYLSHYYYIVVALLFILSILYHCLINRKLNLFPCYVIAFVQGFINAQAFYPQFIRGLVTSPRAEEAYSKLDIAFLINHLTARFRVAYDIINNNIIYFLPLVVFFVLIFLGYSLFKKNKILISPKEIYLALISLSFSFLVMYISPYNEARYLSGIFPIFVILLIILLRLIPSQQLRYLVVVMLCIIYIIKGLNVSNKDYLYRGVQNKLIFKEMPSAPVYFLSATPWAHGIVSAYFVENQKYKVLLDEEPVLDFSETGSKQIFLIIEGYSKADVVKNQIANENWMIKKEVNHGSFVFLWIEKGNWL